MKHHATHQEITAAYAADPIADYGESAKALATFEHGWRACERRLADAPKSFFAVIGGSGSNVAVLSATAKYFTTLEAAQEYLKKLADDRRHRLGVDCFQQTENSFSFILGWEEHRVSFQIVELPVEE